MTENQLESVYQVYSQKLPDSLIKTFLPFDQIQRNGISPSFFIATQNKVTLGMVIFSYDPLIKENGDPSQYGVRILHLSAFNNNT